MIKRALLLALAVLALALFAVLRPGETDVEHLAPPAAAESAAERSPAAEVEVPDANVAASRASLASPAGEAAQLESTPPSDSKTAVVRIRVRDSDSKAPVVGAAIELEPAPEGSRTDEHGEVELRLPVGSRLKVLHVKAGEGSASFVPYEHNVDELLTEAGTVLDVLVDRGRILRGFVLEHATGRPIEGAKVTYLGLGGRPEARTLEDGSFELAGIHAGRWTAPAIVAVEHPLYLKRELRPASSDLGAGATPLRILLYSGLRIAGRIVDGDRAPVAGAIVVLATGNEYQGLSDEHGRFEIGGLDETDQATLNVPTQVLAERAILGTKKELGALNSNRLDLELQVRAAVQLQIYAELADGRPLRESQFEISCPAGVPEERSVWSNVRFSNELPYAERIVPFGPPIEIEVFASAYDADDPRRMLRGKTVVHPEPGLASPHAVHVVLSELHRLEIPPAPPNAQEQVVGRSGVTRGAFDVRLIDADSGKPIGDGRPVTLRYFALIGSIDEPGRNYRATTHVVSEPVQVFVQDPGWLRLRAPPGKHIVELQYGEGPRESFTFSIPWSGHAQGEWRLRSKP